MKRLRTFLSKLSAAFLFTGFATLLFCFPNQAADGVKNGLNLCSTVVLPALFPFTVASVFLQHSGIFTPTSPTISSKKRHFFLSKTELAIFVLSVLGGYPVGACLLEVAWQNGVLSKRQALCNLCFCINAGPTFYISVIGLAIFHNAKVGIALFFCNIFSCLILTFVTRIFCVKTTPQNSTNIPPLPLDENLVQSVTEGCRIMLGLSAFVTLFSTLNALLEPFIKTFFGNAALAALLEITGGCLKLLNFTKSPAAFAFFISFGGLSVLCQVKFSAKQLAPPFWLLALSSLLRGSINALLVHFTFLVFPTALFCFLPAGQYTSVLRFDYRSLLLAVFIAVFLLFTAKPLQKSPVFVKKDERSP